MAATNDDETERNLMRIRGLQARVDELQAQLTELPYQIGARVLALTVILLLAATWMWPDVQHELTNQHGVIDGFHSGFGVFVAPWKSDQASLELISRIALVVYLLTALALLGLSPRLRAHTIVAGVGTLAMLLILVFKPEPRGDIDEPALIYRWTAAPYFALACWVGLLAVGLVSRNRSD